MKRLFFLFLLLALAGPAAAQTSTTYIGLVPGANPPVVAVPSSSVNGAGVSTQSFTEPAGTGTQTAKPGGRAYEDFTATGSTGGGAAADVSVFNVPANTLSANGNTLEVHACAAHAANANSTTFRLFIFGTSTSGQTVTTSSGTVCGNIWVTRTSSTTASYMGGDTTGAVLVQEVGRISGLDFTGALVIKYQVQAATTTNDLIGNLMTVDWQP